MDYYPGGDLLSLISKNEVLSEEWSRFYAAEILLALESIHNLGFLHRYVVVNLFMCILYVNTLLYISFTINVIITHKYYVT